MKPSLKVKASKAGDQVIVDGLLAGMAAGTAMILFLILVGWMFSEPPSAILARFSPAQQPWQGLLLHLGMSAVYGVAFRLAGYYTHGLWGWHNEPLLAMLAGVIYGSFLWLLSGLVLLSVETSPFASLPVPSFAVAHLVYGVVLGVMVQRQNESDARDRD
jgi:hypothetical protein